MSGEDTTLLVHIRDYIDEHHAVLDSAVEKARHLREVAEAEDERIRGLATSLLYKLRHDYGLDTR